MKSHAQARSFGYPQALRLILAGALLLASVPVVVVATVPNSGLVLTADICHPLQSADRGSAPSVVPLLPSHRVVQLIAESGEVADAFVARPSRPPDAPDPPPPKSVA